METSVSCHEFWAALDDVSLTGNILSIVSDVNEINLKSACFENVYFPKIIICQKIKL